MDRLPQLALDIHSQPRTKLATSPLHIHGARGIRNYVESSVWLAGQGCATLVAVRHLSIKPVKSGN
jgi:hypothetical protein